MDKSRLFLIIRIVGLALLFASEVLALTLRFDTNTITSNGTTLSLLLENSRLGPQWLLALIGSILLQRPAFRHAEWQSLLTKITEYRPGPLFWVIHLATYLALWMFSVRVFDSAVELGTPLAIGWSACAMLTGFTWLILLAPLPTWIQACWLGRLPIAIAIVVASVVVVLCNYVQQLWIPLSGHTFHNVSVLLRPWFTDLTVDPVRHSIVTPRFAIEIAPACSGFEGMGLALVFLTIFVWGFRDQLRFPAAFLIVPFGVCIAWILNSIRIAVLFVIGDQISPAIAIGGFHSQAGWLAFLLVTLGSGWLALNTRWLSRRGEQALKPATQAGLIQPDTGVATYLLPFFVLMLSLMIVSIFSVEFDRWYSFKVIVVAFTIWRCWGSHLYCRPKEFLPAALCGTLVFVMWYVLETPNLAAGDELKSVLARRPNWEQYSWLIFRVTGSVITVPIAEELAFRGFLMRRVVNRQFQEVPWSRCGILSLGVSSLLFGFLHERIWAGTIAGLAYGLLARQTRSVSAAILAHSVSNALIAAAVIIAGKWWLWI